MPQIIEKYPSAQAALQRVAELQTCGVVDIFRGQTKQWPISSSLARLKPQKRQMALLQLRRFVEWSSKALDLPDLRGDSIKACAVAQHYGIPTPLIDFTNDPLLALFFATDDAKDFDTLGCIFCLSRAEVKKALNDHRETIDIDSPALVDIDVSNLWRLQAQRGLFINWPFGPQVTLDTILPMRVITFCHSLETLTVPLRKRIYPDRKSRLEIRLDQFFREDFIQDGLTEARKHMEVHYARWDENNHAFLNCELPEPHRSWNARTNARWSSVKSELFHQVINAQQLLFELPKKRRKKDSLARYFSKQLATHLRSETSLRKQAVTFKVVKGGSDVRDSPRFVRALVVFWDGVRQLPFSDAEICVGFGHLLAILYCSGMGGDYIKHIFGDVISGEFSVAMQAHFRAPVSQSLLKQCLRKDFYSNLDTRNYPLLKEASSIIYHVHDVRRLFTFRDFQRFMISTVIPGQIAQQFDKSGFYRGEDKTAEPDWIAFNPLDVTHIRTSTTWMASPGLRNRDRVISLHCELSDEELKIIMLSVLKQIEAGERPSTVTFSGFQNDDREIFNIPDVAVLCDRLVRLGFPSVLEVTTMLKQLPEAYNPLALGAIEVWMLATGRMLQGVSEEYFQALFYEFIKLLPHLNQLCESICGQMDANVLAEMGHIRIVGLFGRAQALRIQKRREGKA